MRKSAALLTALLLAACATNNTTTSSPPMQGPTAAPATTTNASSAETSFRALHDAYVREFLRRNPSVNTYLGGAGLDPSLREVDGRLRDHSQAALEVEDRWLAGVQRQAEAIDPATLTATSRIDRNVLLAQARFLLHQHQERKYQQRSLDTYTDEPFRSIDFQLQGMTQTGASTYGTDDEWSLVVARLNDAPRFLR